MSSLTAASRAIDSGNTCVTEMVETIATAWTDAHDIELFEQTRVGKDGYAFTLLWATHPEADEDEGGVEELTAPQFRSRSRQKIVAKFGKPVYRSAIRVSLAASLQAEQNSLIVETEFPDR